MEWRCILRQADGKGGRTGDNQPGFLKSRGRYCFGENVRFSDAARWRRTTFYHAGGRKSGNGGLWNACEGNVGGGS